jgi:hypothetical protein
MSAAQPHHLINPSTGTKSHKTRAGRTAAELLARTPEQELEERVVEVAWSAAMCGLTVARYLTEHVPSLQLGVMARLVSSNDTIMALAQLVHQPPWARTNKGEVRSAEGWLAGCREGDWISICVIWSNSSWSDSSTIKQSLPCSWSVLSRAGGRWSLLPIAPSCHSPTPRSGWPFTTCCWIPLAGGPGHAGLASLPLAEYFAFAARLVSPHTTHHTRRALPHLTGAASPPARRQGQIRPRRVPPRGAAAPAAPPPRAAAGPAALPRGAAAAAGRDGRGRGGRGARVGAQRV